MITKELFNINNIISKHTYRGIEYNLFKFEGNIGWSAYIHNEPYGNFIQDSGEWFSGNEVVTREVVNHKNAQESIDLILKK